MSDEIFFKICVFLINKVFLFLNEKLDFIVRMRVTTSEV